LIAALALLAACASSPPVPVPPRWTADGTPILPTSPEGWARYQRERRLADGQEHYPMDALHRARLHSDAMPHYSTALSRRIDTATKAQAPQWEWLGPDNVAGRMRTLVFDPRDPDRMIAGGVSGGLWLTEN